MIFNVILLVIHFGGFTACTLKRLSDSYGCTSYDQVFRLQCEQCVGRKSIESGRV